MQHPGSFTVAPSETPSPVDARAGRAAAGLATELATELATGLAPLRSPWKRVRRGALPHGEDIGPAPAGELAEELGGKPAGKPGGATAGNLGAGSGAESAEPMNGAQALAGPPLGIERRLVRRAQAMWESLRAGAPLPPAQAAAAFHGRLFDEHAIEFALPPHPADPQSHRLRITRVGQAIASLGLASPGSIEPDMAIRAAVGQRLAALGARAVALCEPILFEIDTTSAPCVPGMPPILLRAVALPFARPEGLAGPTVVVVASWRHLLPPQEAAAIQKELAAAIDWLRQRA